MQNHPFLPVLGQVGSEVTTIPLYRGKTKGRGDLKPTMYFLPYNSNLKQFSRDLRNNSTLGEVLLWQELRAGSIRGYKFNRQKPLDNYIVDFYCKKLNLVIEVDGSSHYHESAIVNDKIRQSVLEEMGLRFLRFDDLDIKKNMVHVIDSINQFIDEYETSNPPNPLY
ncbi:endonuclease domain-containing protein [Marinoscillum pacificum]|uniref:endonuclease domain-containing protein n=1 Tax=Marinoscillum pacificum TaxID=392723 RepID=UPI0021581338|nr:DUF559 domain-containing protein [Marinoscillum pacificum]